MSSNAEQLFDEATAHAIDALRQLAHVVRQPEYPREQLAELRAALPAMRAEAAKAGYLELVAAFDDLAAGCGEGD